MSFSDLQPETWAHILSFVKRETPPPKTANGWEDLHQQDLLTAMKTSWAMFDLGAPLLYDQPVVADVRSFFLGVGENHQAAVKGLKTRLLEHVTLLQLEYLSPDREPAYRSLLGTSVWGAIGRRWQHAEESTTASSTGVSDCLQNVAETVNMLGPTIKLGGLLPNLRTVNLAAHSRFTWQATEIKIQPPGFVIPPSSCSSPLNHLFELLLHSKPFFYQLCYYTNIVHSCQYDQYGPLALPEPSLFSVGESSLKTFTTHITYDLWSAPAIIAGLTNRWLLADHLSHCAQNAMAYFCAANLAQKLNNLRPYGGKKHTRADKNSASFDNTRIEVYGLFRGTHCMKAASHIKLDHDMTWGKPRAGAKRTQPGNDMGHLENLQACLDAHLVDEWRGKVFVKYMIGVEPCPACGLEEVDRYCGDGEADQNQHGGH